MTIISLSLPSLQLKPTNTLRHYPQIHRNSPKNHSRDALVSKTLAQAKTTRNLNHFSLKEGRLDRNRRRISAVEKDWIFKVGGRGLGEIREGFWRTFTLFTSYLNCFLLLLLCWCCENLGYLFGAFFWSELSEGKSGVQGFQLPENYCPQPVSEWKHKTNLPRIRIRILSGPSTVKLKSHGFL